MPPPPPQTPLLKSVELKPGDIIFQVGDKCCSEALSVSRIFGYLTDYMVGDKIDPGLCSPDVPLSKLLAKARILYANSYICGIEKQHMYYRADRAWYAFKKQFIFPTKVLENITLTDIRQFAELLSLVNNSDIHARSQDTYNVKTGVELFVPPYEFMLRRFNINFSLLLEVTSMSESRYQSDKNYYNLKVFHLTRQVVSAMSNKNHAIIKLASSYDATQAPL